MVASLCQIFNTSTHFHKWGPKEHPTLDNIGPHDIIIDHQFNRFATRGQQQLSRLFIFHYCSHMPCIYCVYIMMSIKDFDSDSDSEVQQQVFTLYHPYNPHACVIWFSHDVIMAKETYGHDNGWTILSFSTDDGCMHWWWWLHQFWQVICDTHSQSAADKYAYQLYNCCQVSYMDTGQIWGIYAQLDCIMTSIVGNGGYRHSMQVTEQNTHSHKELTFFICQQIEGKLQL